MLFLQYVVLFSALTVAILLCNPSTQPSRALHLRRQRICLIMCKSGPLPFPLPTSHNLANIPPQTEDVTTLLTTNLGSYAAACSLDFSRPTTPQIYYDTFALRDSLGLKTATLTYPYFASHQPLSALRSNGPIPVKSCWNGMIVFDAAPFYTESVGLMFRGTSDELAKEHVEGSECCLVHADNWHLREEKGVYVNPNVRVSYNLTTYEDVNPGAGREDVFGGKRREKWPGKWEAVSGIWRNREARWFGWMRAWSEAEVVRRRVERWVQKGKALGEDREERGVECLVNEMQVLFENGWQHV